VDKSIASAYDRRFAAIYQAVIVLLTYVITTFLTFPIHLQDIMMKIVSTVVVGYTVLVHLQLYAIYPVLVLVPTLLLAAIIHFFVTSSIAQDKVEVMQLLNGSSSQGGEEESKSSSAQERQDDIGVAPRVSSLADLVRGEKHLNRRQSLAAGLSLLHAAVAGHSDKAQSMEGGSFESLSVSDEHFSESSNEMPLVFQEWLGSDGDDEDYAE
jgi:hypothetical protein